MKKPTALDAVVCVGIVIALIFSLFYFTDSWRAGLLGLFGCCLIAVVLFFWFSWDPFREHRLRHQANTDKRWNRFFNHFVIKTEPVNTDSCAACEWRFVDVIDDGVYRCQRCQHVGGPGYASYAERVQSVQMSEKSPEERQQISLDRLDQALLLCTDTRGFLDQALEESRRDIGMNVFGDDHSSESVKRAAIYDVQERCVRINKLIEQAGVALDEDLGRCQIEADFAYMQSERFDRWTEQERATSLLDNRQDKLIHKELVRLSEDLEHSARLLSSVREGLR